MKDLYREETNHDVYADYCCEKPAGSYADEYVRWLEEKLSKLSQHDVSGECEHELKLIIYYKDGGQKCRCGKILVRSEHCH